MENVPLTTIVLLRLFVRTPPAVMDTSAKRHCPAVPTSKVPPSSTRLPPFASNCIQEPPPDWTSLAPPLTVTDEPGLRSPPGTYSTTGLASAANPEPSMRTGSFGELPGATPPSQLPAVNHLPSPAAPVHTKSADAENAASARTATQRLIRFIMSNSFLLSFAFDWDAGRHPFV